jgi:hypothetical protein
VHSSLLLRVKRVGARLGRAGLLLEAGALLCSVELLRSGGPLLASGARALLLELVLRLGHLGRGLSCRGALGARAIVGGSLLALAALDLGLEPLALGSGLDAFGLELGLGVRVPGLSGVLCRIALRLGGRLLKPALPREVALLGELAGELLRLPGELADRAAGHSFIAL